MLENLYGINSRVRLRAQWHRLHHRRKQAQRLARLTRSSAQRWICARLVTQQEIVNPRWKAFHVDTGAGGTVWPKNADYACEKISSCKSK